MTDFSELIGLSSLDGRGGDAALAVTVEDRHLNPNGTVHGGVIATLVDAVMGQAVRGSLEEGQTAVTVSMTVSYLAPTEPGDQLRAVAQVRKRGGRITITEADVSRASDDAAVAHAVATFTSVESHG